MFKLDFFLYPVASVARVSLAKLMLSEANFLILDELYQPSLDIASKEILEEALNSYTVHGAVCFP
ncbi:MAG: hypothetical protein ACLU6Y_16645 [Ruminococcus sp.]